MPKILHRVRATFSKEVEIPDELWQRYNEGEEEAQIAVDEIISKYGCKYSDEDCEEVEDEWYDEVKD